MAVTRQCPECGRQYATKVRFCREDGSRLVEVEVQPGPTPLENETKAKPAAKAKPANTNKDKADAKAKEPAAPSAAAAPAPPAVQPPVPVEPRPPQGQGQGPGKSGQREGKPPQRGPTSAASARPSAASARPSAASARPSAASASGGAKARPSNDSRRDPRRESRRDHGLKEKPDPMLGRVIAGRFLLEAVIGAGATGVVYRATHRALGRTMAVKLLKPQFIWDERSLQRFLREARTCSLLDHPNIVYLYDFGRDDHGEPFLVMEYAEGETLHATIQRSPSMTLPVDRMLGIMVQMARALEHAHSRSVIHRDIKPENIVLTRHGGHGDWVKILDFGVARIIGQAPVTGHGQVTGTAEFIAPETLVGDGTVLPAGDLYAVGIIFHDALVGRPPFTGKLDVVLHQHLHVVPPLLSERAAIPGIPLELDQLVARLLDKDPAKRPTASELALELEQMHAQILLAKAEPGPRPQSAAAPSTQRLNVNDRSTSVLLPSDRRTEIYDRLGRPTQIVGRPSWPTHLSPQAGIDSQARSPASRQRGRGGSAEELLNDAERQTGMLHAAAVTLAAQIWPGGWPQALLNLLQHIDSCDQQERQLSTSLHAHEERIRHQDAIQSRHQKLRRGILALSERLRSKEGLDEQERARLYADLEGLERAFFASDQKWSVVPRGVLEPLRQRLLDVQATRRRSRLLFSRLLVAMPCPPSLEDERRTVVQLLAAAEMLAK